MEKQSEEIFSQDSRTSLTKYKYYILGSVVLLCIILSLFVISLLRNRSTNLESQNSTPTPQPTIVPTREAPGASLSFNPHEWPYTPSTPIEAKIFLDAQKDPVDSIEIDIPYDSSLFTDLTIEQFKDNGSTFSQGFSTVKVEKFENHQSIKLSAITPTTGRGYVAKVKFVPLSRGVFSLGEKTTILSGNKSISPISNVLWIK